MFYFYHASTDSSNFVEIYVNDGISGFSSSLDERRLIFFVRARIVLIDTRTVLKLIERSRIVLCSASGIKGERK